MGDIYRAIAVCGIGIMVTITLTTICICSWLSRIAVALDARASTDKEASDTDLAKYTRANGEDR